LLLAEQETKRTYFEVGLPPKTVVFLGMYPGVWTLN